MIWVSFYVNREKVNFSTSVKCDVKDWDNSKSKVKKSDANFEDKNLIIENVAARINNVFVKYRLRDKKLTKDAFLKAYNRPDDFSTFHDFVKSNKAHINTGNELSTHKSHEKVMKKVQIYAPDLHFDDITAEWVVKYFWYLRKKLNNNENTAYKDIGTLKKYVLSAIKMGYMTENPFDDFKIKKVQGSFEYLNEDELKVFIKAYNAGRLEANLHNALEFFLFLCFSSLHIADAKNLCLEQFSDKNFEYFRQKTKNKKPVRVKVPISEALKDILRNIVGARKKGLVFQNLPAEQTINRRLKELAKILGVNKKISTKAGRHTFATYYLAKTKDITSLKEILGHSDLRETLVYAHVLDESKQEGIACFNCFAGEDVFWS